MSFHLMFAEASQDWNDQRFSLPEKITQEQRLKFQGVLSHVIELVRIGIEITLGRNLVDPRRHLLPSTRVASQTSSCTAQAASRIGACDVPSSTNVSASSGRAAASALYAAP
jgi:hypothetical protein